MELFEPNVFDTDLDFYIQTQVRSRAGKDYCLLDQGFNFLDFLIPADRKRASQHAKMELSGTPVGPELYMVQTEDDDPISITIDICPIFDRGRPVGMRLTVSDLSGKRRKRNLPTPMRGIKAFEE